MKYLLELPKWDTDTHDHMLLENNTKSVTYGKQLRVITNFQKNTLNVEYNKMLGVCVRGGRERE